FRAMIIESSNPVHSLADSRAFRDALDALELVVVIDIALTETARYADYVLPAASQYEKWEATFFTLEPVRNSFPLPSPVLDRLPDGARAAAVLWASAQQVALRYPEAMRWAGHADGDALFEAILAGRSGVVFTEEDPEDSWRYIKDSRIRMEIPELLESFLGLAG